MIHKKINSPFVGAISNRPFAKKLFMLVLAIAMLPFLVGLTPPSVGANGIRPLSTPTFITAPADLQQNLQTFNFTFSGFQGSNMAVQIIRSGVSPINVSLAGGTINVPNSRQYNASVHFPHTYPATPTALPETWNLGRLRLVHSGHMEPVNEFTFFVLTMRVDYVLLNAPSYRVPTFYQSPTFSGTRSIEYEFTVNLQSFDLPFSFTHWRYNTPDNPNQVFSYAYASNIHLSLRRYGGPTWNWPDVRPQS